MSNRSDLLSKLMSDHLLMGHRMLATSCTMCGCILFDDLNGKTICVSCDLDKETGDSGRTTASATVSQSSAMVGEPTPPPLARDKVASINDRTKAVFNRVSDVLLAEVDTVLKKFSDETVSVQARIEVLNLLTALGHAIRAYSTD